MKLKRDIINLFWRGGFILYWLFTLYFHKFRESVKSIFGKSENDMLRDNGPGKPITFSGENMEGTNMVIAAAGDLILEKALLKCIQKRVDTAEINPGKAVERAFDTVLEKISPFLKGDLVIGNLETVTGRNLSDSAADNKHPRTAAVKEISPYTVHNRNVYEEKLLPNLNNHPLWLKSIKKAGFNLLSTANNHAEDRLSNGIDETINCLKAEDINYSGTLTFKESKRKAGGEKIKPYTIIEANGIHTAFFSYTERQNPFFNHCGIPNKEKQVNRFCPFRHTRDYYPEINRSIVSSKREDNADLVIFSAHWGIENTNYITPRQKRWAHALADAGADIILGHHPHALQPMEKYTAADGRETFIIYSLGNFIAGIRKRIHIVSAVIYLDIVKNDKGTFIKGIKYLPTRTDFRGNGKNPEIEVGPLHLLQETDDDYRYISKTLGSSQILHRHSEIRS